MSLSIQDNWRWDRCRSIWRQTAAILTMATIFKETYEHDVTEGTGTKKGGGGDLFREVECNLLSSTGVVGKADIKAKIKTACSTKTKRWNDQRALELWREKRKKHVVYVGSIPNDFLFVLTKNTLVFWCRNLEICNVLVLRPTYGPNIASDSEIKRKSFYYKFERIENPSRFHFVSDWK